MLFFFSQRDGELSLFSFSLHTHTQRCAHTSSKSSFFPSLSFCSVCLSLLHYCTDFRLLSRLINKREVAHSHVLANWWERKGVLFSERGISSLSDSWMPACCSSRHDTVFAAGVVFVWVLLPVPELLVCHFMRGFSVSGKL